MLSLCRSINEYNPVKFSSRNYNFRDTDSVGSQEQEVVDKTDRKSEKSKSVEKKICKDGGDDGSDRGQKKILSSDPDLEFVPVDVSLHFMLIK